MGQGKPYFAAQPVAKFLTTQWDTIKINLKGGFNQVCAGGFIFDWCDEYWKANNNNIQIGGPDGSSMEARSQAAIGTRRGSESQAR
jgi:hypothetical protein